MSKVGSFPTLTKAQSVNFHRVWRAASFVADKKGGFWDGYVTVGEVVDKAEVSRNTAKKYLSLMCEYEKAVHVTYQKSVNLYQILSYAEGYK